MSIQAHASCPSPCDLVVSTELSPDLACLEVRPEADLPGCVCFVELWMTNNCAANISIQGLGIDKCIGPDGSPSHEQCNPLLPDAVGSYSFNVPDKDGNGDFQREFVLSHEGNDYTLTIDYSVAFEEGGCSSLNQNTGELFLLVMFMLGLTIYRRFRVVES